MRNKLDADKIKNWRKERCWSQEHLADLSGISIRTIQRVENGGVAAPDSAQSLAAAFGVDATVFMIDAVEEMDRTEDFKQAKNNLQFKLSFWIHLFTYLFVMALLISINLAKSPEDLWVLWPAIGWGIGVAAHGMSVALVEYIADTEKQLKVFDA